MKGRDPRFALVTVPILAVAIGACTAMFSIVHAVLLRPMAVPNAARVVMLWSVDVRHDAVGEADAGVDEIWGGRGVEVRVGIDWEIAAIITKGREPRRGRVAAAEELRLATEEPVSVSIAEELRADAARAVDGR